MLKEESWWNCYQDYMPALTLALTFLFKEREQLQLKNRGLQKSKR